MVELIIGKLKMATYYQILGLRMNASSEEIKKAYRKRARELHPDTNDAEDAHERFVELNEAYQVLLNQKSGNYKRNYKEARQRKAQAQHETYEEYVKRKRKEARARAAKAAKMKYDEFIQSSLYRSAIKVMRLIDYVYVILGCFIALFPIIFSIANGVDEEKIAGTIVAILFCLIFGGSMIVVVLISKNDY